MSTRYTQYYKIFSCLQKMRNIQFNLNLVSNAIRYPCHGLTYEPDSYEWTLRSSKYPSPSTNLEVRSLLKSCLEKSKGEYVYNISYYFQHGMFFLVTRHFFIIAKKFVSIVSYVLKHQGHCAGGWAGRNTVQNNLDDCFRECTNRPNIGYFAFNSKNGRCACYFTSKGCPDDDRHNDYNAYHIDRSNNPII